MVRNIVLLQTKSQDLCLINCQDFGIGRDGAIHEHNSLVVDKFWIVSQREVGSSVLAMGFVL